MRFVPLRQHFVILFFASFLTSANPRRVAAQTADSHDEAAAVQARAESLMHRMTVEEKVGQLTQLFIFSKPTTGMQQRIRDGRLGSALFLTDPTTINDVQHLAVEGSRLHIPLLFGYDVIHGFRTIFPVPLAMAASFDPDLVKRAQTTAAMEARAVGVAWAFGPMVDIARDPRWGRMVEGAGEDPYLGSVMARAQVQGFQGDRIGAPRHVLASVKHFAGYGAAEGGRDYDSSDISDDQLFNVYLPPFKSAVDAGAGAVMSAYMDLNGVPATGNRWLLTDVLRKDWGFSGFVVSDADAVKSLKTHGYAEDAEDSAVRALNAGVDMEMAAGTSAYSDQLPQAVRDGRVSMQTLDAAVLAVLKTKLRLGLFEHPYVDVATSDQVLSAPEHRSQAANAAERTAVLLRNENSLLPVQPGRYRRIAVVGPLADSKADITGPWAFVGDIKESVSVLDGLKAVLGKQAQLSFAQGVQIAREVPSPFALLMKQAEPKWSAGQNAEEFKKAVAAARNADLTVIVLGEKAEMSGEAASNSSLDLPGDQQRLLEAVVACGKPVILVLVSARPLNIQWANQHVPAILDAWYPGTQGGTAIANLLTGKASPGGRLPFTWPRNVGQVPVFYAHDLTHAPAEQGKRYYSEASTPLFPFGFGLGYTSFVYTNVRITPGTIHRGEPVTVQVDVENVGERNGDSVAQLYLHQRYGTSSRPIRELKGFERVALSPHEKRTVSFTVSAQDLTYWSSATRGWVQDASTFDVGAGSDATVPLTAHFTVAP